jgi:hypothetical protein
MVDVDRGGAHRHAILGASFVREGTRCRRPAAVLFIDDEKVGEGRIMTQPGNFSLVGKAEHREGQR